MHLNPDFSDLLQSFNDAEVRYLVVGAHALAYYARPRGTADFDVWVEPSEENAIRVFRALGAFGAPLNDLRVDDLTGDDVVFQIGVAPLRIDVMTGIDGVSFDEAWPNRAEAKFDGQAAHIIGIQDLIRNKEATGRPQDVADVQRLREIASRGV